MVWVVLSMDNAAPPVPFSEQIAKASVLIEAIPYLQLFRGQTFLIKFGGSAMDDPALVEMLLRDVVFLELAGISPPSLPGPRPSNEATREKQIRFSPNPPQFVAS